MPASDIRVHSVLKCHLPLLPIAFKTFRIHFSNYFNRRAAVHPWPIQPYKTNLEPFLSNSLCALNSRSVIRDGPSVLSICDPLIVGVEFSLPENFEGEASPPAWPPVWVAPSRKRLACVIQMGEIVIVPGVQEGIVHTIPGNASSSNHDDEVQWKSW